MCLRAQWSPGSKHTTHTYVHTHSCCLLSALYVGIFVLGVCWRKLRNCHFRIRSKQIILDRKRQQCVVEGVIKTRTATTKLFLRPYVLFHFLCVRAGDRLEACGAVRVSRFHVCLFTQCRIFYFIHKRVILACTVIDIRSVYVLFCIIDCRLLRLLKLLCRTRKQPCRYCKPGYGAFCRITIVNNLNLK